ncbi:Uncharacterised protein [Mycobacteroides abscessus subsp. abscessus]|nr:Uncharacterised protein [Mycobacteroides abscessus subsp. abscessus]
MQEDMTRQIDLPLTLQRILLISAAVMVAWLVYDKLKARRTYLKALVRNHDKHPEPAGTTQVKGKTFTFDNPKLRDLVHNMTGTDGGTHKSVRQAAAEAGFKLPPPGQDIGRKIDDPAQVKPGMVIVGAHGPNAIFLGEGESGGQLWTYSEIFGPIPLSQIFGPISLSQLLPKFYGTQQGFYALSDETY